MNPLRDAATGVDLNTALGGAPLPLLGVLAVLALAPFAVVMLTSFSKIAIVLAMLRSALGTQQAPPTIVLTGLAAVLTAHIMAPVAELTSRAVEGAGQDCSKLPHLFFRSRFRWSAAESRTQRRSATRIPLFQGTKAIRTGFSKCGRFGE